MFVLRILFLLCLFWLCLMPHRAHAGLIPQVQISGISDINLPTWNMGDPAINAHIDICVYSTGILTAGTYEITATGSNGFNLVNGARQIPYTLKWDDGGAGHLGENNGTSLISGVLLLLQVNGNSTDTSCGTGATARLNLSITQAAMTAALAGTYTGSVNLTIAPL